MVEYPSITNSSKAPRKPCIAFAKYDGSNVRVKWTQKQGFCLFGSRHQLIDETHPHLGEVVPLFNKDFAPVLDSYFRSNKLYRNEKEITIFGEFFGRNSFAGIHVIDEPKEFVMFDVMFTRKNQHKFLLPQHFVSEFDGEVRIPDIIYRGNLNDELIADVRAGKYPVNEGVICKGTESSGAYKGGVWMAKIKTQAYFDKLKQRFGEKWTEYAE